MSSRLTLLAMSTLAVITMAACGGGGTTATAAPIPTQGTTATSVPPAATQAAGTTTAPGGSTTDTCSLFTAAELKTATGLDWGAGKDDGYGQCIWLVGDATVNDGNGQIVAAFVDTPLATLKTMFTGGAAFDLNGTDGYWNPETGVQTFWIDQGSRTLAISVDPITENILGVALKLANIALSKL